MQVFIRAGFSSPVQASFFLLCAGDSVSAGYHLCIMPRPDVGEYLVHARLNCWISRNTLPWDIVAQLVSAQNEMLLWLAEMNYVKIQIHCKA